MSFVKNQMFPKLKGWEICDTFLSFKHWNLDFKEKKERKRTDE